MSKGIKNKYPIIPSLCFCGCNKIVYGSKQYICGHNSRMPNGANRGKHYTLSDATRKKMSASRKGRKFSEISKDKISEKLKGNKNGIGKKSALFCANLSLLKKGNKNMLGKHHTSEAKSKISNANKGLKNALGAIRSESYKTNLSIKNSGINSGNWRGGISFLPYCSKFNNKLKKAIRNRDNHICQFCNVPENGHKHHVHHIHYDKENCHPDLITLCNSCNSTVNGNRQYYESFFMNILNNRGLLNWRQK